MDEWRRSRLLRLLSELSDRERQQALWVNSEGQHYNLYDICVYIYTIWWQEIDSYPQEIEVFAEGEEYEIIRPLGVALLKVLGKYESAYDMDKIIEDPDWPEVVTLAGEAYQYFLEH